MFNLHHCLAITSLIVFVGAAPVRAADDVDYVRDVFPIFQAHCIGCHAADDDQGGLVMETFAGLMHGGEGGAVITPGAPMSSRLLLMASGKLEPKMPPDDAEGPSEKELAVIAAWIEHGATGPEGEMPKKRLLRTPTIATGDGVVQPVTAIAVTSNAKLIATARYGSIELKSAKGTPFRTITTEKGKINSLSFSRDGSRLLVGSGITGAYGTVAVYSVESGEKLREMVGHRDSVYVAEFSPDEASIATGGYDRDILMWNTETGDLVQTFQGHNGAITDLAFSPDGKVLVSASSDETAKVWNVKNGQRLDTLSQSEGEVFTIDVTSNGKFIIAGSGDNRLRAWRLLSQDKPRINPLIATRFVDESGIVQIESSADGAVAIVLSEAGNIKVVRTSDWQQVATLEPLGETPSDAAIVDEGDSLKLVVALMNGEIMTRQIPRALASHANEEQSIAPIYMDLGSLTIVDEPKMRTSEDAMTDVPRGAEIRGVIASPQQADRYRFSARRGEMWAIDADAISDSQLDPIVTILDDAGNQVLRTRLQAVRDSYFTFRGKDSSQSNDFRLFAWEEMRLNDYLYASGEVTRLWMHPRGPDSGFNVYPGQGDRWTYFGTSHLTHALGEPAYVVRSLQRNEQPVANGLPVFDIFYENDDDPQRIAGKNSRLLFSAPDNANYTVAITDTRGQGGEKYGYQMRIRAAEPKFTASLVEIKKPIRKGTGRECVLKVNRMDGFEGEVTFKIDELPAGLHSTFPVVLQAGQNEAMASIWADEQCPPWEGEVAPQVTASAEILGRQVERSVGPVGKLTLAGAPQATPQIVPIDGQANGDSSPAVWTLNVTRGETLSARVVVTRDKDFDAEISFGKEFAGRTPAHGVYVDNIGLNGLLLLAGESQREFFITADITATPGKRYFYLDAAVDGGVTTRPIVLEVQP